jgi:hypothetical protein
MVHALTETWRVLKPEGYLLDLRPISIDVPLFILTGSGWQPAGLPDQSPDRIDDIACDGALRSMVRGGLFKPVKRKYFDVNNYWNSLRAFKADIDDRWQDNILVSQEIWREARRLYKSGSGKRRVRIPFRKKISVYQKCNPK